MPDFFFNGNFSFEISRGYPQWFSPAEHGVVGAGPLARPFARSLAPLTHALCSTLLAPLARSAALIRLLATSWDSVRFDEPFSNCFEPMSYCFSMLFSCRLIPLSSLFSTFD